MTPALFDSFCLFVSLALKMQLVTQWRLCTEAYRETPLEIKGSYVLSTLLAKITTLILLLREGGEKESIYFLFKSSLFALHTLCV